MVAPSWALMNLSQGENDPHWFPDVPGKAPPTAPASNFYPSNPPPKPVQKDQVSAPKAKKFLNNGISRCAGTYLMSRYSHSGGYGRMTTSSRPP